jgi:glutaredoxin
MKKRQLVAFCCALAACTAVAQSQVHRWVDKDGKVHFSDTLPPPDARESSSKNMGGGYVAEEFPYAVQQAMKKNPVMLYTAPSCGDPCNSGRQLLSERGIPFREANVQANATAQEALKKLIGGLEVPTLTVGGTTLKGYESEGWGAALTSAGYPASRLPGQSATRAAPESPPDSKAAPPATPK